MPTFLEETAHEEDEEVGKWKNRNYFIMIVLSNLFRQEIGCDQRMRLCSLLVKAFQ